MSEPENRFPTIRDLHAAMADLIDRGLGDHPVQVVIAPASTMRAIERTVPGVNVDNPTRKPPLMIELPLTGVDRLAVTMVSTTYLSPDLQ